jgi:hypothetical protein
MSSQIASIIVNGYVGKELTLSFLNRMLIMRGYNVLYLKLSKADDILDILVNNESINYSMIKNGKIIFDEIEIINDIFKDYNCDILITRSSRYNNQLNPIIYGITKYNMDEIDRLNDNAFLSNMIPIVSATQSKEIMQKIYTACDKVKTTIVISEHYHYSYIKYDTGLDINYSYQSFILALNISELVSYILVGDIGNIPFKKVKLYGYNLFKLIWGRDIPKNIILDNPYYVSSFKKDNITFYCDVMKTASVASDVIEWVSRKIMPTDINICIFNSEPSKELIKIVEIIKGIKFETIYIADYEDMGYSYEDLVFSNEHDSKPVIINDWSETMYRSFATKPYQSIVVDNFYSIFDWVMKYTSLHNDKNFNVLCFGSKKLIDNIVLKI